MKISRPEDLFLDNTQLGFSGQVWFYASVVYNNFRAMSPGPMWTEYRRCNDSKETR